MADEDEARQISIGTLAEIFGVSVATIRSWEERYGWPLPARTDGGHRRYSTEQLGDMHLVAALRKNMPTRVAIAQVCLSGASITPRHTYKSSRKPRHMRSFGGIPYRLTNPCNNGRTRGHAL